MRVHEQLGPKECDIRGGVCTGRHVYADRRDKVLFEVYWHENQIVGMGYWPFRDEFSAALALDEGDRFAIRLHEEVKDVGTDNGTV